MLKYSLNIYQRILAALALTHTGFLIFLLIIDPTPEARFYYLVLPFALLPVYLGITCFFFIVVSAFNQPIGR